MHSPLRTDTILSSHCRALFGIPFTRSGRRICVPVQLPVRQCGEMLYCQASADTPLPLPAFEICPRLGPPNDLSYTPSYNNPYRLKLPIPFQVVSHRNSRRLLLFWDLSRVPEENSRKISGKLGKNTPSSRNASDSRILGTGKGKPAPNLGSTLARTWSPPSVRGFCQRDSRDLLEFF